LNGADKKLSGCGAGVTHPWAITSDSSLLRELDKGRGGHSPENRWYFWKEGGH